MLKYQNAAVVFQEVPDEVSLAFSIANCGKKCKDCHSPSLQQNVGEPLTFDEFKRYVLFYKPYITCVCLLGSGQASSNELAPYFQYAKQQGLKTCLYIGDDTDKYKDLHSCLDYIKIGSYIPSLGGLDCPSCNQKFYRIKGETIENITYKFQIKTLKRLKERENLDVLSKIKK